VEATEEVRALRDGNITELAAFVDGQSLGELERHTEEMQSKRLQEIVVSFGGGLAACVVISAIYNIALDIVAACIMLLTMMEAPTKANSIAATPNARSLIVMA
jgi:hypothetical protein